MPELAISSGGSVALFDPLTLEPRGAFALDSGRIAIADVVGDERAEIISSDARAYTVTRSGETLIATEVWNANITGDWNPYPVNVDGHAAIVLHDVFGFSAQLATFWPSPSLRTLVPAKGPRFTPVFTDVDGDGQVDFIAATNGDMRAIDIASGVTIWDTVNQTPHLGSVSSPVAIDLDGDGASELAWSGGSQEDAGIVAMSIPPNGVPRWRSDFGETSIVDWTLMTRSAGSLSIAYLSDPTLQMPSLGRVGFLGGPSFADEGGSAFSWLPGYDGIGQDIAQLAITTFPVQGSADAVVVAGAQYPMFGGDPIARWLWTFDGNGTLQSARSLVSRTDPQHIAAAHVLDRPERQLVVAGWMPYGGSGPLIQSAVVDIVDYDTGELLWQSMPLPTYDGAPLSKLEVADIDADGQLEIAVGYGGNVAVFRPSMSNGVARAYAAQYFSLLGHGVGHAAKLATIDRSDVAVYDGLSMVPEKTFVLPEAADTIALFNQTPDDTLMFATGNYQRGLVVRSYADGAIAASDSAYPGSSLFAGDIDGDDHIEIIGWGAQQGFTILRLVENETIFRDGFDQKVFGPLACCVPSINLR